MIIDEADGMPSAAAYAHRFGSLICVIRQWGSPRPDYRHLDNKPVVALFTSRNRKPNREMIADVGGVVVRDSTTDLLTVNDEFTVSWS